ncbi:MULTISPECIES: glutamine synthetase beta-grasp domain-containing protein [Sinorhizobium]|nr:glutamine synthetase beta-grasp domain-containing protein [Sinorhizobium meliloti]TWA85284.1 biotin carboxylase [Ensifer sp. SEMIA 134]
MQTTKDVLKAIKDDNVQHVVCRFTDPFGKWHHIPLDVSTVDEVTFAEGIVFDGSSMVDWKAIHEPDMILMPDPTTAKMDPFFLASTLRIDCDILEPATGEPHNRGPRGVAKWAGAYRQPTGTRDAQQARRSTQHQGEPSTPRKALILIEGSRDLGPLYIQAAHRLGLHPITLSTDPAQHGYLAAQSSEAIRVDTDNLEALIQVVSRLRRTYGIAGITCAKESVYATVGKLCLYFDLPGPNPAAIEQCCRKFTQRRVLKAGGVPVPAYRLAANVEEAESAAAEIGLPVILKPSVGIGSSGVRLCRSRDEVADQASYLLSGKHMGQASRQILVEEFVHGPYFTADIMGDEVVAVGSGDFGPPPHFVYREYTYPASLTDNQLAQIADVSLRCLRSLGLGWGPANVELRWTRRGPVVIEVNPRLAGTPDPQLIQLAYGVDLITEHVKLVIGRECDLHRRHSQTAAARFLVPDCDGTLDWIDGDTQATAVPGVVEVKWYVEPKTPIVRKGDYREIIGLVIAASPSLAQTKAVLQRAVELISWSITPFATDDG